MPYNKAVARPAYYKLPATTMAQLEKNLCRLVANYNMATSTKQQHIRNQFAMYKKHSQAQK